MKKNKITCIIALLTLTPMVNGVAAVATSTAAPLSQRIFHFDQEKQTIPQAINQVGNLTGLNVVFTEETTVTEMANPLHGTMTVAQALNQLLSHTGFSWHFSNANTLEISRTAATTSSDSSTLEVNAVATDNRWAPGDDAIATDSVTGTKTNTPLIEIPQAINVITQQEMSDLKPQKLEEALRYTPGVIADFQANTSYFDRIRLRGFYSINNVYLDGMQLTPSGTLAVAQMDPYLLQRIDVLKGPASVLYGQNGTGGLINMATKRPLDQPYHQVSVSAGNNNSKQATLDLSGPLNDDNTLLYRLTGIVKKSHSNIDYATQERYAIAPSITWQPTKDTSWSLLANFQRDPEGLSSGYLPAKGTILSNSNGKISRNLYTGDPSYNNYDRKQTYVESDFQHRFTPDLEFHQNTRYIYVDVNTQTLSPGALKSDERTLSRTALDQMATTGGISTDNHLLYNYTLGEVYNELVTGFDYRRFVSRNDSLSGTSSDLNLDVFAPHYGNLTIPTLAAVTNNHVTLTQTGTYLQNTSKFDRWNLMLGMRRDWAKTETDNYRTNTTTYQSDQAWSGRAGLTYSFDSGVSPYISYSTSFEPATGTDYYGNTFKPTKGKQWEAGVKYQPTHINGLFTAALYNLTRTNISTTDEAHSCANAPELSDCGDYDTQTGEVRVRGLELEGKFQLTKQWDTRLSYTWMDAETTKSNDGDQGKRPTNTPKYMASAWLNYHVNQTWLNGLTLGSGIRYIGTMYADSANTSRIPATTLIDAMASMDLSTVTPALKGAMLSVSVTNLADRKVIGGCTSATLCDYVPGRSILGTVSYNF